MWKRGIRLVHKELALYNENQVLRSGFLHIWKLQLSLRSQVTTLQSDKELLKKAFLVAWRRIPVPCHPTPPPALPLVS